MLLVNFLRNQADAGASWSMLGKSAQTLKAEISDGSLSALIANVLGLNARLAQSLGIHCSQDPSTVSEPTRRHEARVKFYIW